jgi:V8-like Glu-specific endopeptidase
MATEETVFDGPVAETGTSQLYTRHPVNRYEPFWKEIPYKKIGRLFFSVPGGSGSCSASVISPYDIIVTAAHCLYDSTYNRWYDNWAFAPAYRDGSAPYGVFPFRDCWILTQWVNLSGTFQISSWTRYDVGVCEMGYNSIGQGLSNTVGWLGRSWNNLYTQLYHTFGYPSNIDSSRYLTLCISESFAQTTEVVGTGCDMTFGSSGGPLIRGFVPFTGGQSNFVNSVVSGGYGGVKNIYGPRFNSSNIVILCSAAGC